MSVMGCTDWMLAAAILGGTQAVPSVETRMGALEALDRAPLAFEWNAGQVESPDVEFTGRTPTYRVALSGYGADVLIADSATTDAHLEFRWLGTDGVATLDPQDMVSRVSNHYRGQDDEAWIEANPMYGSVVSRDVYEHIDVEWYGRGDTLEYDLIIHPGGSPEKAVLGIHGADCISLDGEDLVIETPGGVVLRQPAPIAWQDIDGVRHPVEARFVLEGEMVRWEVGAYDDAHVLRIDPMISTSTYFGASDLDRAYDVAFASDGTVHLFGMTRSLDLPVLNAYQPMLRFVTSSFAIDYFVTKFTPDLSALEYSTYIGAESPEAQNQSPQATTGGIVVDSMGAAWIVGDTSRTGGVNNYPITAGALQSVMPGNLAGVVSKFNAMGGLEYSTYLGGTANDGCTGVAIDSADNVYVTGFTGSRQIDAIPFPVTPGAYKTGPMFGAFGDDGEAFVSKFDPAGNLVYSTYIGGQCSDDAWGIAVDSLGRAFVVGNTNNGFSVCAPLPVVNAAQPTFGGLQDAWFARLNAAGSAVDFYSYFGGSTYDRITGEGNAVAVDSAGNAWFGGMTESSNIPLVNEVQSTLGGVLDGFIVKVDTSGAFVVSTLLGGTNHDRVHGICVDSTGAGYATGQTRSADFPMTADAIDNTYNGNRDIFVTKILPGGNTIDFSTYVGGSGDDYCYTMRMDSNDAAWLTGTTTSTNYPVTAGAFQMTKGMWHDAFLTKLIIDCHGDANGDAMVDFDDLNEVLNNWGTSGAPGIPGDVTNDGTVDFNDLNLVLGRWGSVCV